MPAMSKPAEKALDLSGDEATDEEMTELLQILTKFRRQAKPKTRKATLEKMQSDLFADAHAHANEIVCDGTAYFEQLKVNVTDLRQKEQDNNVQDLAPRWAASEAFQDCTQDLLEVYPTLIDDLSHKRASDINAASCMLETNAEERGLSRRKLLKNFRARVDQNLENERIATDAEALIKHYKNLLKAV